MSFVAIQSGAEAVLPRALADRFQLQPDDGDGWCIGPGGPPADVPEVRGMTGRG